ncbi:MAG: hypothetical protein ACK5T6_09780, partial [Pirellula sp.]
DTLSARIIVDAAGAWGDRVAVMAGRKTIGLQPKRRSSAVIPGPDGADIMRWPLVGDVGETWYCKPQSGKLLVSPADATPVDPQPVPKSKQARLAAKVVATNSGIDVFATWDGKPLKDVEIKLYCAEGHEEGSAKTDGEGKVSFTNKQVEDGLNGIMFGNSVEESGELDGKPYTKAAHYLTTTFFRSESQRQP